jgi:hypothetical protein
MLALLAAGLVAVATAIIAVMNKVFSITGLDLGTAVKTAATIGMSIKEKRNLLPGKIRSNKRASPKPRVSSMTEATNAKIRVNRIELQKFGSTNRFL